LTRCGIPVPKLYDVNGKQGFMVMEDVGDRSLALATEDLSTADLLALYRTALAYLNLLAESTREACTHDILGCHMQLDRTKLMSEMDYLISGISLLPNTNTPTASLHEVANELSELCEIASSGEFILCHRDYHARNLFIKGKTVYVLDHQDMRLGHRFYDRVSLLWDPYVAAPDTLKEEFWGMTASEHHEELRAVAVQRLLKALGTYINVLLHNGPKGFFTSAKAAVRDLVALIRAGPGPSLQKLNSMLLTVEQRLEVLQIRVRG
jgi:aminoglycoside/choline kinase family phosphotransferase